MAVGRDIKYKKETAPSGAASRQFIWIDQFFDQISKLPVSVPLMT